MTAGPEDRPSEKSLGGDATFAGRVHAPSSEVSLGAERTLGDGLSSNDTIIDDIEIVKLESRYTIEGTLGQGGMGAVLLATDTRLGRKVAIKRILGEAAGSRMAVARFLTEAKAIAALNHPNVVQIYDYGRAADGPFLIMEYVDGGSLLDKCKAGPIPLDKAIDLACQICDGLAKAHDQQIIHRDIKPANVLLTMDGTPKLTDFGLAKAQSGDHGQTMAGAVLGTPDFMPPEQRRDASLVDHRSDLWSLAATIYQMVTGKSPKVIRLHELPQALQAVFSRALEDEKESRYQSARELRDAIRASLGAAGSAPAAAAQEGQCPACGVQNDLGRKFCRSCGGSLEAPCLSCGKPMPMWEEICGSCGTKQAPLLESRRSEMAAAQAKAEGLLEQLGFDKATRVATGLRDEPHPRLTHLKEWAADFVERIAKTKADVLGRAHAAFAEALTHERAADYSAGIRVLEALPEAVRKQPLPGEGLTAQDALQRLQARLQESTDLERVIRVAVKDKALTGLLPKVVRLTELRPDRADVRKLQRQLQERHTRLCEQGTALTAQARDAVGRKDYAAALKTLSLIDDDAKTASFEAFRTEAQSAHDRSIALRDNIKAAVAEQRLDGLLKVVDEYLTITPSSPDLDRLRTKLVQHEEKRAEERRAHTRRIWRRRIMTACVLAILVGSGAVAKVCYDRWVAKTAAIQIALKNETWDSVLKLDPDNVRALVGRARQKLSGTKLNVAAALSDLDRAKQAGAPPAEIQPLLARARGLEAGRLASENNCAAAETTLAEAVSLGAEDGLVNDVRTKLAQGWQTLCENAIRDGDTAAFLNAWQAARTNGASDLWLRILWLGFGRRAIERGDAAAVKAAVVGAEKYGLAIPTITSWKAIAAALDAVSMDSPSQRPRAMAKLRDAVLFDVAATASVLRDGKSDGLRDAVKQDLREAVQAATAASKWDEAIRFTSAVGMIDPASAAWVAETVKSIPPLRNSIGMQFKLLPAGTYKMGESGGFEDETPHDVNLTSHFYIGIHEVTNAQWKRVMGRLPKPPGLALREDDELPVVRVHVSDAKQFCDRLSSLPEEKAAGRVYRLPSEAEWEYACRAGTTSRYSFGEDESLLSDYGWWRTNSGNKSHPVGLKKPNAWGLYDMHGNVSEWVSDWYGEYPKDAVTDPQGPGIGRGHPSRGGDYSSEARFCRTACRGGGNASPEYSDLGFRLALSTSAEQAKAVTADGEQSTSAAAP